MKGEYFEKEKIFLWRRRRMEKEKEGILGQGEHLVYRGDQKRRRKKRKIFHVEGSYTSTKKSKG